MNFYIFNFLLILKIKYIINIRMDDIEDIPDELFPHKDCSDLLEYTLTYYSTIVLYERRWNLLHPNQQFYFIKKIKKLIELEWLNNHIDTDYDDY